MKNIIAISALLFLMVLTGCDESYISPTYVVPSDSIAYDPVKDPVPVIMSMNDPFYVTASRGPGAISPENPFVKENAIFHVYSFLTNNFAYSGEIDYRNGYVPESELPSGKPMQCLVDDPETGMGAATKLQENGILDFVDYNASFCYSQINQEYKYNFFAYHIDDAIIDGGRAVREKDNVYLDIKIDGTQDVISAVAKLTDKQFENVDPNDDKWLFANILNRELVFSTLTGHRFIVPVFEAKHCLARFKFNLQGEDAMSDAIYVQDIYIKAQRDWRFTVAADNVEKLGLSLPDSQENLQEVHLCDEIGEVDGSVTSLEQYTYHVSKGETLSNIGLGMLLPPREAYDLYIKCAYISPDGKERSYVARYALNYRTTDDDGHVVYKPFEAGSEYNITMHVFGYQNIQLSMEGLGWETAPDDIPFDNDGEVEFLE